MATHRAPQELFDGFIYADESKKRQLRQQAADWLASINHLVADGDKVIVPDPRHGREQVLVKDAKSIVN